MSRQTNLPIHESVEAILASLRANQAVVLKAPPGAGKTTGVPPAILDASDLPEGKWLIAQPRRLAARQAAAQLARIIGGSLGDIVGYHVRFDRCESARSRIVVLTYGMLLRRLQNDPFLESVAGVVLDEFHERSLEADLSLGMIQKVRDNFRPDLRLVVMSATLDPEPLVRFLGSAVPVTSDGKMFPVDIQYFPAPLRVPLPTQVAQILPDALAATRGHVLVFLPGVREIQQTNREIRSIAAKRHAQIHPLYADLAPAAQDRVLAPNEQRKIILATNVAETSLTIDGVTTVIDSGLARISRFDPSIGLPRLQVEPISQASATQRTGRAGRTSSGICYRLWHKAAHASRPQLDAAEIHRADFAPAALALAAWGETDPLSFPWLEPPSSEGVKQASELLKRLGAIDESGRITTEGQLLASIPLHPSLGKLLVTAARQGVLHEAALAAALLTERDPFRVSDASTSKHSTPSHAGDIQEAVERLRRSSDGHDSHRGGIAHVQRVAKDLVDTLQRQDALILTETEPGNLATSLIAAFPDRVARRREAGSTTAVMVGGKGVRVPSGIAASELALCLQINAGGVDANVSFTIAITRSDLDERWIKTVDEPFYQASTESIVARRRTYYMDLLLSETPIACPVTTQSAAILAEQAELKWKQPYPPTLPDFESLLARIELIRETLPKADLPLIDTEYLNQLRVQLALECQSIDALAKFDWSTRLMSGLSYEQTRVIDRETPLKLCVPSGNQISIQYNLGKPPQLHVRIQELFGWQETPRIVTGRVPLQLHLLGPNRRTEQITDDLKRFWESSYHQVRKDLRGRYPKHHWPEHPQTAQATRNGMQPRTG